MLAIHPAAPRRRAAQSLVALVLAALVLGIGLGFRPNSALATHFRADSLAWTKGSGNTVTFQLTATYRRDYPWVACGPPATQWSGPNPPAGRTVDPGSETFDYGDGNLTVPVCITVNSFDTAEDTLTGTMTLIHTYSSAGTWTAGTVGGCCTLSTLLDNNPGFPNHDQPYRVQTLVDLAHTTGSPVSSMPAVVFCPQSPPCNFSIPATDPDGLPLSFRFTTATEAGLPAGTGTHPSGTAVDSSGHFTWTSYPVAHGLYATQVIVEAKSGNAVVAYTEVTFILDITNSSNHPPIWDSPPTPADGTVINVTVGGTVSFSLQAHDPDPNPPPPDPPTSVHLGIIGRPAGATFTTTDGNPATGTFSWTPTSPQDVLLHLTAEDQFGLGNLQRSVTIHVLKALPTLSTEASAPVTIGGTISDQATLAGGFNPSGSITFKAYGPNDATCANAPAFTSAAIAVSGNGTYASGNFTPTTAGTYRWVANYTGDTNNDAFTSACGAANESVQVNQATPTLSTQVSAPITVGGTISDQATLAGGYNPGGSITFTVYGPLDATCAGTPAFTSAAVAVNGGGANSGPFVPTASGIYTFVASYGGDANNAAAAPTACNDANESVVVAKAAPTLATAASPSVPAGGPISDTAFLADGVAPTGTITFNAFGPNNPTCTGTATFTSSASVSGNGPYTSAPFMTTLAGTYNFVASYSGDANNNGATSACGAANESVVVTQAAPVLKTQASSSVPAGGTITDTAMLAAGVAPTGTITFTAYGPNDSSCTGTASFTSTVPVSSGNGNYTSGMFTPTAAGTYRWIASYSGDANNNPATSACNDTNESVDVTQATPTLSTQASAPVTIGGTINDQATLGGGFNPGGSITFKAYGPNDATCTGTAVFSSTVNVSASGANSGPFTPTAPGTYRWVASYSGDTNNAGVNGACNDPNESVVINQATPTLSTQASAAVTIGGAISDQATLTGGYNPSGTVTFKAYGPNDATCGGTPAFTSAAIAVSGGGANSGPFSPTTAGTYRWVASYSGDNNNTGASGACNDANESAQVKAATPAMSTQASAPVVIGGTISDQATLTGGYNPGGTVTFKAYGPNDATCANAAAFTSAAITVSGGGANSGPFTPAAPGTYRWVASYSGDNNNAGVNGACNDPNESVVVTKAPTSTTVSCAPNSVVVNATTTCTATVKDTRSTGATMPTGTVSFTTSGGGNFTSNSCTLAPSSPPTTASCTVTYTPTAQGDQTITATYAGDSAHTGSSGTTTEHVNKRPTTTTVSCALPIVPQGLPTTCTATVKDTGATGAPVPPTGSVSFSSSGAGSFSGNPCTLAPSSPPTTASCTVTYTPTAQGDQTITATYGGDSAHLGSSGTTTITVVPFAPGGGSFVIGDRENTPNASVNFWGAQWAKNNSTSSGSSVASFKGFADTPATPSCGGSWSTAPGNSSKPPSGPLPPLMAVIVTSTYSKSGPTISGTVLHIVIVKTDPGYDSNPGHDGTGTIVEQYC